MPESRTPPPGETHAVENVAADLADYNLYAGDAALQDAVLRDGGAWGQEELHRFGAQVGRAEYIELGYLANRHTPELETHDRFGHRVDEVRYHAAYHELMHTALGNGLHSSPWTDPGPGAHVVRAAKCLMHSQIEAGHGCPVTMTFAAIPSLRLQPELAERFEHQILCRDYDPRNVPAGQKPALTVGMGMTEKQGGSDVRANTTRAVPEDAAGPGQLYSLTGHKWFLSAPMCDLFLVLAQAPNGLSCFLVPRWRDDGQKNALQVIRLKDKMGNRSNASSEVEFRDAQGWLIGEEGRGVPTIIEMVSLTRFDCIVGSAALMRAGVANAIHHCRHRAAFGQSLLEQPLMRNVLADLALEYEAAVALAMRLGRALDQRAHDENERDLIRLATAVGKYWVCKRAPQHSYEVMECIGGSGVMENAIYPRLFRESVINPIWEGSGNVQCLDVLRAIRRSPQVLDSLLLELNAACGRNARFDKYFASLQSGLRDLASHDETTLQLGARQLVDQMALGLQASLLLQHAPEAVATAFCHSRLTGSGAHQYGALPATTDFDLLLQRADPLMVAAPAGRQTNAAA